MLWPTIWMMLATTTAEPAVCASMWDVEQCEALCLTGDVVACEAAARLWGKASPDMPAQLKQQSLLQRGCSQHRDSSCAALASLYHKADEPARERAALVQGCTLATNRSCRGFAHMVAYEGPSDDKTRIAKLFEEACDTVSDACRLAALVQTEPARQAVYEQKYALLTQNECRRGDTRSCLSLFQSELANQPEKPAMKREAMVDLVATGLLLACNNEAQAIAVTIAEAKKANHVGPLAITITCPLEHWEDGGLATVSDHDTAIDAVMGVTCRKGRSSSCQYQRQRAELIGTEADMKLCRGDVQAQAIPACRRVLGRGTTTLTTRKSALLSLCDAGDTAACRQGLLAAIETDDVSSWLLSSLCDLKITLACRLGVIDDTVPDEIETVVPSSQTRSVAGYTLKTFVDGSAVAKNARVVQLWTWTPGERRRSRTLIVQPTAKPNEDAMLTVIRSLKVGERARVWPADFKSNPVVYEVAVLETE